MPSPFKLDPSATAAFSAIRDSEPVVSSAEEAKAVVIGGGTGAPASIQTLLSLGASTSAVVAMADDGGSTGQLRNAAHVTPPGDVRKCLVALAADPSAPLTNAFKYRFEFANNHTLGNLMLSALENATESFPEAIRICEDLLDARGHVYPSTLDNITLCGRTLDGETIEGQALLSHAKTALNEVWIKEGPQARAYPLAIKAICEADLIVLGPGSLFTSIIPNLLVPGVLEAIESSRGKVLFVCGLADMQGETWGLSAEEHLDALIRHGMGGLIDYMLVHTPQPLKRSKVADRILDIDTPSVTPLRPPAGLLKRAAIRPVSINYESAQRIQQRGPVVIARNLADPERPTWHDPLALRAAFAEVLKKCRSQQR